MSTEDIYNDFASAKVECYACKYITNIRDVVNWGHEPFSYKCPNCHCVSVKITEADVMEKIAQMCALDQLIASALIKQAKNGNYHENERIRAVHWAALVVLARRVNVAVNIPLSYVQRMFMIEMCKIVGYKPEYSVLQPIPVIVGNGVKPTDNKKRKKRKKQKDINFFQ